MINIGQKFRGQGGADTFPVFDITAEGSKRLGYIKRVDGDVYYVVHNADPYRDNRRYRTWDSALAALTPRPANPQE